MADPATFAADGSAFAAAIASIALFLKVLPPVIDSLKNGKSSASPENVRRETEARMILDSVASMMREQTDVLREISDGIREVHSAIKTHDQASTSAAQRIISELKGQR